jgi:hypothetical protein
MNLAISELYTVIPAKTGIQGPGQRLPWTPAFAGVTGNVLMWCAPFRGCAPFRVRHSDPE